MEFISQKYRFKDNTWKYEAKLKLDYPSGEDLKAVLNGDEVVAILEPNPPRIFNFLWTSASFGNEGKINANSGDRWVNYSLGGAVQHWVYKKIWSLTSKRKLRLSNLLEGCIVKNSRETIDQLDDDVEEYIKNLQRRVKFSRDFLSSP